MSIESFDKTVSQNECFSELRRQVKSNNTDNTDSFSSLVDLQDVVFTFKGVDISSDFEVQIGKTRDCSTVNLFLFSSSKGFSHIVNNFSWANEYWCSSVNYTQNISNFIASSIEDDVINSNTPVVSSLKSIVFERTSVIFRINSS